MKQTIVAVMLILVLTGCTHMGTQTNTNNESAQSADLSGIPYSYFIAVDTTSEKFHPTTVPQGALLAPCNGFIVRQQQTSQEAKRQGDLIAAAVSSALAAEFDSSTIYYNPLKQTDISFERLVINEEEIQIFLEGTAPKQRCVEEASAQLLQETVKANAPGREVRVYLNGILWQ